MLSHFVITVTFCNKIVAFCNKKPDTFSNKLVSHFIIKQLSHFVIISVAFYNKLSLLLFISRKLRTSKIDCGDKISKKPFIIKREVVYLLQAFSQLVASCLAYLSILMHFQNYTEMVLLFFVMHC